MILDTTKKRGLRGDCNSKQRIIVCGVQRSSIESIGWKTDSRINGEK